MLHVFLQVDTSSANAHRKRKTQGEIFRWRYTCISGDKQ